MRIKSIGVGGFKNLAFTIIELEGINALVAPNNFGKSNFLEAIHFALIMISASSKTRNRMMAHELCIPLVPQLENESFRFEVEFENDSVDQYRCVRYGFSFEWARTTYHEDKGRRIIDETLEMNSKWAGIFTSYLRREKGQFRSSHSTRSFRSLNLDSSQLAIDILTAIEDIDICPAIKQLQQISLDLCEAIETESRYEPLPFEINEDGIPSTLAVFDDEDLPRSLYQLSKTRPDAFDDFLSAVFSLFPEFERFDVEVYRPVVDGVLHHTSVSQGHTENVVPEIPFRLRDEMYRITIMSRHLNQPVGIQRMSKGTRRIIWLIANIIIAKTKELECVGIEEIESSIHPRMIENLLQVISDNQNDLGIILSSHSPFLAQYLKPQHLYIGVPNDSGIARFAKIRTSKISTIRKDAHKRGLSLGEYLFDLMSDDVMSARTLRGYLEEQIDD